PLFLPHLLLSTQLVFHIGHACHALQLQLPIFYVADLEVVCTPHQFLDRLISRYMTRNVLVCLVLAQTPSPSHFHSQPLQPVRYARVPSLELRYFVRFLLLIKLQSEPFSSRFLQFVIFQGKKSQSTPLTSSIGSLDLSGLTFFQSTN